MEDKRKIHFTSLGCPRNFVDTEAMLGIVMDAGYEVVGDESEADFLIVNTCGFLEEARQEAMDNIQELLEQKKPSAKMMVTGCMVKNHRGLIQERFPEVHAYLGSGDIDHIIEVLEGIATETISEKRSFINEGGHKRVVATPSHYAYLKVAEGCRKRCTFCLIPDIKGPLRSRSIEDIVSEFESLLDQGVREVILIAQDLGDYGKDRYGRSKLTALLKALLGVEKDFWLRLMYLYPDEIDDEIIALIKSDTRICHYVDIPLQHVNDNILKAMGRKTFRADIEKILDKLRRELPDIVIRTSLITGFPGEKEEYFQELLDFIKQQRLDNVGIFRFSPEEGTVAATMPLQVDENLKEQRYHQLMKAQQDIAVQKNTQYLGKVVDAIIDGYHPDSELLLSARMRGQCPEVDGQIIINDPTNVEKFGDICKVEITDVAGYDLVGHVLPS
ncbi:MAG: 30S ribosomal protein S12 methylthiotransferase RimO [Chlamydiota bacterium]